MDKVQIIQSLIGGIAGIDEAHKFESPEAQPWKLIDQLGKNMCEIGIPKVIALTGTPIRVGPDNLAGPVKSLTDDQADNENNPRKLTLDDINKFSA